MSETTIKVRDNGPYVVSGPVKLIDVEGNEFETKATFSICRCGQSSNKPFCDGTHKEFFESVVRANDK